MDHLLNPKLDSIQISGIRKIANLVASDYKDALTLTIGQPDFPTPAHIVEAAKQAMDMGRTVYTANAGLPDLRRAASAFLASKYGMHYNPENEVIVTAGASQALDIALRTILKPGDEVILPGPIYPGYDPLIRLCGAVPVYVDTTVSEFKLSADLLRDKLTDNTKAILLNYPSNPTGRLLDRDELEGIAALIAGKPIFAVSDEIYSELIYDQPHTSIASIPAVRNQTIVINGVSKSHSMTGWRIGFTFAPEAITREMVKVHQYNVTCASSISQYAALEALTAGIDDARPMNLEYKRRRDFVHARLTDMGFEVAKPEGAFYIFPSIQSFGLSSQAFTMKLLETERVAVVPGDAFSETGEGYIRISYAYAMDILEEAMDRLDRFVRKQRQS
jgi:aminotransferase